MVKTQIILKFYFLFMKYQFDKLCLEKIQKFLCKYKTDHNNIGKIRILKQKEKITKNNKIHNNQGKIIKLNQTKFCKLDESTILVLHRIDSQKSCAKI